MEADLLAWLKDRLPTHPAVRLGPGDDAAVLAAGRGDAVVTVDLLTDGVDFDLRETDPRRVGHKALAVSLSDVAAMAARPIGAFVAVCLPRRGGFELARRLCEGMIPLAKRYETAIAGGDTNSWDGPLVVSVTLLGEATPRGPLRRDGARPGDRIVVTGSFGGSILGKHLDFEPRVREAILLAERYELHAGIDCSDGLSLDLRRLLDASGCGAVVDLPAVPIADDARHLAERLGDGSTPLDHALGDGEDFELILAVPPREAERMVAQQPLDVPLAIVGECITEPGLWQTDAAGRRGTLPARGWEHQFD